MPGTANPNNFLHLDIHRPPRIDHLKAKVTFQVADRSTIKKNSQSQNWTKNNVNNVHVVTRFSS